MIRVGIIGFGGMGQVHFKNYEKIKEVEVASIVSNSEDGKIKAAEYGIACYETIE